MRRACCASALLLAGWLIPAASVLGLVAPPPPGPVMVVNSDAVFVGRVIAIEPVDIDAKTFPRAKATTKYTIAVVEVNEVVRGLKAEKTLRVGFIAPMPMPKPALVVSSGGRSPSLQVGQEGLFMIDKHHEGKFYQAPNFGYFVSSQQKNFSDEVNSAKKVVAVMGNASKALQSANDEDRLLAAAILITKYRTFPRPGPARQEPIDAEESKLILNALASAKWQASPHGQFLPWMLFNQLGIRRQDGWNPGVIRSVDDQRQAVQGWVRAHADTYRIKRFVPQKDQP